MAETESVVVRLYEPGDEAGLADLLQATFDVWPKIATSVSAQEHMLWKLSSDPESKRFQVLAAAGNKIVGCRLFFFNWFRIQGQRLCCRQGFDLAIHPDYQGQGILNDMWFFARKHFDDQNDFNFGIGAHPAALHMRVAQGNIKIENKVQVLVHPLDAPPPDRTPADFDVRIVSSFDGRADALFEETSRQFDFVRERSAAFLNWRHADPRSGSFTIMCAEHEGVLLGYIVLSTFGETGIIADVLALPGRLDVVEGLIQEGLVHFAALGMSSVDCWMPTAHVYRPVLVQSGFTHKKRVIPLSYRYLRAPASQLEFLTNPRAKVHIMANDTDLV
jgi:hypothetical protein